jgi:hypothetical protein
VHARYDQLRQRVPNPLVKLKFYYITGGVHGGGQTDPLHIVQGASGWFLRRGLRAPTKLPRALAAAREDVECFCALPSISLGHVQPLGERRTIMGQRGPSAEPFWRAPVWMRSIRR